MRPTGSTIQVSGSTPLRLVVTDAFAEDVAKASKSSLRTVATNGRKRSETVGNGQSRTGAVNATGRTLWVALGGSSAATEVPPDGVIPHVLGGGGSGGRGRGGRLDGDDDDRYDDRYDDADPTYLLVEILETEEGTPEKRRLVQRESRSRAGSQGRVSRGARRRRRQPRRLVPTRGGNAGGAALVDVSLWRSAARALSGSSPGVESRASPPPLRVRR